MAEEPPRGSYAIKYVCMYVKIPSQLSAMFTCRDGKEGKLSDQASKMLNKSPGAVYIASYKEPLGQSDCWNTNKVYKIDGFP